MRGPDIVRFVAIDVETANANLSSICQIGLVRFEDGQETDCASVLVDPQTWFDSYNVAIHGIDEAIVEGAPTFEQLHAWLNVWIADDIVVCHTHFDRVALAQACEDAELSALPCRWLDSARVVRRAWPQFARSGYGLANVANFCGIEFAHHDAVEDARTAGLILIQASTQIGHDIAGWLEVLKRFPSSSSQIRRVGDGDGALVGESIVFTGALQFSRAEAADRAAEAGGDVTSGVTKHTTMLVVGDQDIARLNGGDRSNKHDKALKLMADGQPIRIVGESDFIRLSSIVD